MKIKEFLGITLGILNVISAIIEKIEIKSEGNKIPDDNIQRNRNINITLKF